MESYLIGVRELSRGKIMAELSIIVPVYNVEKYLCKCVDSILNQTFQDFELILVDDGSPDNSGRICDEYAKKDSRIIVIHQKNGGLCSARNSGIKCASGNFIAFVDSDDYVAPNMYETLINVSKETGADMVKCGYCEFVNDEITAKKAFSKIKVIDNNDGQSLLPFYLKSILCTVVWNGIYSKDLAKRVVYPEGYINEDNYASPMYLHLAKKLAIIPGTLYFYRQNYTGLSKSEAPNKRPLDIMMCYSLLHEDLCQKGLKDSWFIKKLKKRMARTMYQLVQTKKFVILMDEDFFTFLIDNLGLCKSIKMYIWKIKKRIILK